jgi:hypothetical protein
MNKAIYRNFGDHESIVCNHSVDVNGSDHAGIRWYELRRIGAGPWTIYQLGHVCCRCQQSLDGFCSH